MHIKKQCFFPNLLSLRKILIAQLFKICETLWKCLNLDYLILPQKPCRSVAMRFKRKFAVVTNLSTPSVWNAFAIMVIHLLQAVARIETIHGTHFFLKYTIIILHFAILFRFKKIWNSTDSINEFFQRRIQIQL